MRRGRILGGFAAFALLVGVAAMAAPLASAASPAEICADMADGHLDGTYSAADLAAYAQDPTVQGYCTPIPPTTTPVVNCVYTGSNGEVTTTTATSGRCTPPPCVYVGPGGVTVTTPADTLDQNGNYVCAPQPQPPSKPTPASAAPAAQPIAAVAGAQKTLKPKPAANAAGTQKTKTPTAAAPLATTRTSGTLPFTGAQLTVFAIVGLALLAGGILLRLTSRKRTEI